MRKLHFKPSFVIEIMDLIVSQIVGLSRHSIIVNIIAYDMTQETFHSTYVFAVS